MAYKEIIGAARNDSVTVFLESDALVPERYREVFHSRQISPEKRLMIAVLNDAIQAFFAGIRPRKSTDLRYFQEAEEWIMATGCDGVFSFEWICNLLGLEPAYLRTGLKKLQAEARAERRSGTPSSSRFSRSGTSSVRSITRLKKNAGSRRVFSPSYNPGA